MVKMYGGSDSLKKLLYNLRKNWIFDFSTLGLILDFKKNWKHFVKQHQEEQKEMLLVEIERKRSMRKSLLNQYQKKIADRAKLLNGEKEQLPGKIVQYSIETTNPFKRIFRRIKLYQASKRLDRLTHNFTEEVEKSSRNLNRRIKKLEQDAIYRETNFDHLVMKRSRSYIKRTNRINRVLDRNYSFLAGAIGEHQVITELTKLPDTFTVINDFSMSFENGLYYPKEKTKIKNVQVDHLVIGPSGIFLLETKNWSKKSLQNPNLFSPVKQIRRTSYALFKFLDNSIKNNPLRLCLHRWGKKKITLRSILLMINAKPKEQFQFVKVLTPKEVVGYISFFEEIYSPRDVNKIVNLFRRNKKTSIKLHKRK